LIARYRERGVDLYFRADAAFAKREIYELLEHEDPLRDPLAGQPSVAAADRTPADAAGWATAQVPDGVLR
jgi:hypothetical protein